MRLPLDGRAAAAKLPDEWRLQLYIEEQKAFFRADVKPSDTVAEIEAALSLWATVPAVLSYGGAPFHPKRPRRAGLFEQRRRRRELAGWHAGAAADDASRGPATRRSSRPKPRAWRVAKNKLLTGTAARDPHAPVRRVADAARAEDRPAGLVVELAVRRVGQGIKSVVEPPGPLRHLAERLVQSLDREVRLDGRVARLPQQVVRERDALATPLQNLSQTPRDDHSTGPRTSDPLGHAGDRAPLAQRGRRSSSQPSAEGALRSRWSGPSAAS